MQLHDFWQIILQRRRIVMLAFIATVLSTLVGSILWPAKYKSTATIMLDYDSSNPMNMNMIAPQALNSTEYVNTQIEIIKSRRIAEGVIDILSLDKMPNIITSFNESRKQNPLFFWRTPKTMDIKRWLADGFLSRYLKIEPARDSRFLYIRVYSPDPSFSAALANAYAKSYNNYNLELKVSPFKEAEKWFSEKLKDAKAQSDKASEQLREYQQKKGIITQQNAVYDDALQRFDQINKELASAKTRLYETKVAIKRLENSKGNYESLPEVLSNSFVQGLKTEKVKLETQLTELSGKAGTNHPQYMRLKSMLETLNTKLNTEMHTIVSALRQDNVSAEQRVNSLESTVEGLKKESTAANLSRYEIDSFNRESESSKQAYDLVLKKFSESSMQSDITRTNVFLVDAAVPALNKHSPIIKLNLALSVFVGLFLGVGLAIFFDYFDDTIKNAETLEREFGLAVFGTISNPREI